MAKRRPDVTVTLTADEAEYLAALVDGVISENIATANTRGSRWWREFRARLLAKLEPAEDDQGDEDDEGGEDGEAT